MQTPFAITLKFPPSVNYTLQQLELFHIFHNISTTPNLHTTALSPIPGDDSIAACTIILHNLDLL